MAATKTKDKADTKATEPQFTVDDVRDNLPGVTSTMGNRDGDLQLIDPNATFEDWITYRPDANEVVERVMHQHPEDVVVAAQLLTIISTYETGDVSSWADAAQAAGIAEVGKGNGPQKARDRYESVVPAVNGQIKGATKVGRHYRAKYLAALPAEDDAETTEG